ncbi:CC0125/CC1285 family lipoprotein [Variovorax sp. LjRoot178]|uniref:CC0125/CC1285 family lipoprotein n=1 Tax=Variovorax sp. LjRoot178 TaxID=3342277 RepID=UPI003F511C67
MRPCLVLLLLSTVLFACTTQPSTPYRPMGEGQGPFGYASETVGDLLFRVEFWGSNRTPARTTKAFALFRAAELARTLNMVAFTIEDGPFDRSVLEGDDVFSTNDRVGPTFSFGADTVGPVRRVQTSTIWIPIHVPTPEERYERTASKLVILRVRMHPEPVASGDPRTFITEEVLDRLGPRIVRGQSS